MGAWATAEDVGQHGCHAEVGRVVSTVFEGAEKSR